MVKGIALVQILIFSAILTIVALFFSGQAIQHVKVSQAVDDKTMAKVLLHDAKQKLFYAMLVEDKSTNNRLTEWNFYGEKFFLNDHVAAKVVDINSKINLRYPNRQRLTALLLSQGISKHKAEWYIDTLIAYQSQNNEPTTLPLMRNGPISDKSELLFIDSEQNLLKVLMENTTLFKGANFNPIFASHEMLAALYGESKAAAIIELRNINEINREKFIQITGVIPDENTFFTPSNDIEASLEVIYGKSRVTESFTVKFSPYASGVSSPIRILEYKNN